jgi:uncharacterized protein (TIGR03545 family)
VRTKGIISLIVLIGVIFALMLIFTNSWLEKTIENIASPIVGAKVEIDNLDVSLTDLRIRWDRLQVTNPKKTMTNLFETGRAEFDLEFIPLLSGKYIIESLRLNDIRTNTPRETDGRLEKTEETEPGFIGQTIINLSKQVESNVSSEIFKTQQKLNVDSVLKLLDIQSIGQMKILYTDLDTKYSKYQTMVSGTHLLDDAKHAESRIKSLDLKKMKTLNDYQQGLTTLNNVYGTIDTLQNFVSKTKNEITGDLRKASSDVGQVDDWISADYDRAMAKAKLPQLNAENMGRLLFGDMLINRFNQYLGYIATGRSYSEKFSGGTPEKEKPPRLKGQDIRFSSLQDRPEFWIKEIELSGQTADSIELGGTVDDIVSNQKIIGKPTVLNIHGGKPGMINMAIDGEMNYLGADPREKFRLKYAGFSLAGTRLSESRLLPNTVKSGAGDITTALDINGNTIDGSITFTADNIRFAQDTSNEPRSKIEQIIHSVVAGISSVEVKATVRGDADHLSVGISSNLDRIFADRLQAVAGEEIRAAKAKIKNEIDRRIGEERQKLDKLVADNEKNIRDKISEYDQALKDLTAQADAKKAEIEKAVAGQKGDLEKKVKNILKF